MSIHTSGFGVPVLVVKSDNPDEREKVTVLKKGEHDDKEVWLQQLLFRHPEALPTAEIDASFSGLIPLCMEMDASPGGFVDVVYVTSTGKLVLLETKLWRNQESRREVIVQIIDYARVLAGWDYSSLDNAVRQARKNEKSTQGENFPGIFELVAKDNPGLEEAKFNDWVTRSLQKGDFLLLIAGDGIREGLSAIAQYLDKNGTLHFTFGLIECAIYDAPDRVRYVQPRVLAQSKKIERIVFIQKDNKIVEGEVENDEATANEEIKPGLLESREKYQKFWAEFLERIHVETSQPKPKPAMSTNQFFAMPKGSECRISAYLGQSTGQIGVYLGCIRNATGDRIYDGLLQNRNEIDKALGVKVEWHTREKDGQNWVIIQKQFPGVLLDDSRVVVQKWLVDNTERFIAVFRPRIDQLVANRTEFGELI